MSDPITRQELQETQDRQSLHLEKIIDRGFDAVNKRLDVANGRTNKLEDRVIITERDVAILLDRANTAETKALKAEQVAGNSKWWATALAGAVVSAIEFVKAVLNN